MLTYFDIFLIAVFDAVLFVLYATWRRASEPVDDKARNAPKAKQPDPPAQVQHVVGTPPLLNPDPFDVLAYHPVNGSLCADFHRQQTQSVAGVPPSPDNAPRVQHADHRALRKALESAVAYARRDEVPDLEEIVEWQRLLEGVNEGAK